MQPTAELLRLHPIVERTHADSGAALVVLVAFLASFLAIRTSTRLARRVSWLPSGIETGSVHVHHLVVGIGLLLLSGFLAFAAPLDAPWWHLVAAAFGVGAGFTVDEFALWVRLEDVYWTPEGRTSFDAVVCTCAFMMLVVIGTRPFGFDEATSLWLTPLLVGVVGAASLVCLAKGRVLLGIVGLFVPLAGLWGVLRLAHPASPWARWRYRDAKERRSRERFAATRPVPRLARRLADLIAGAPGLPSSAPATKEER